jgi:hypothetical protein
MPFDSWTDADELPAFSSADGVSVGSARNTSDAFSRGKLDVLLSSCPLPIPVLNRVFWRVSEIPYFANINRREIFDREIGTTLQAREVGDCRERRGGKSCFRRCEFNNHWLGVQFSIDITK